MPHAHPLICPQCNATFYVAPKVFNRGRTYCSNACRHAGRRRSAEGRFFEKTNKHSAHGWQGTPCWDWTAACLPNGYGYFAAHGKMGYAHRYSWEMTHGPIPDGLHVLHHCDRRCCVNPAHLFLGTRSDNMRDMVSKGRAGRESPHGEHSPNAKLTEANVREIRAAVAAGASRKALARHFGVSAPTVRAVVEGKSWVHVK